MKILNNRECAILTWMFLLTLFILTSARMEGTRKSIKEILPTILAKPIIIIVFLTISYMLGSIYFLNKLDLWNLSQLKNTIIWSVSTGLFSIFKVNSIKNDENFLINSFLDNFKIIAIIQFVVEIYSFDFVYELILIPSLVLVGTTLEYSKNENKYRQARIFLNYLLSIFGLAMLIYTGYQITINFNKSILEGTLDDFLTPPLLTLLFIPFLFTLLVYMTYEGIFIRLNNLITNKKLNLSTKIKALLIFNIRLGLLERWASSLNYINLNSPTEIQHSFSKLFQMITAERKQKSVPVNLGWSPHEAIMFLESEGIRTGYYHDTFDNEWMAISSMVYFGEDLFKENISYYIIGNKYAATSLKIKVDIFSKSSLKIGLETLLKNAESKSSEFRFAKESKKLDFKGSKF